MSLHQLANHLQSAGRGEDKVLIHMTPGEVNGLQKLAQAHGGSLTVNPQTGLPEAGFLSSILPMVAGLALGPAGLGMTALNAGLTVGAVGALTTGSLSKGLMAGFGAYGGAGMGEGLVAAGTPATTPVAGVSGPMSKIGAVDITAPTAFESAQAAALKSTQAGGVPGFTGYKADSIMFKPDISTGISAGTPSGSAMPIADKYPQQIPNNLGFKAPQNYMPSGVNVESIPTRFDQLPSGMSADLRMQETGMQTAGIGGIGGGRGIRPDVGVYNPSIPNVNVDSVINKVTPTQIAERAPLGLSSEVTPTQIAKYTPSELSNFEKAKAGFSDVTSSGTKAWDFVKANPMPFITTGLAAAQALRPKYEPPATDKGMIRPYEYSYNPTSADVDPYYGSAERRYFNPQYTALAPYPAAEGGLMAAKYAVGGPVELMSAENAIGANQSYPQSQFETSIYSNPMMQRPQSSDVVSPSGDAGVNPYTGEARFASGGATPETTGEYKYDYNPQTQQFTQMAMPQPVNTGPIGRAFAGMYGQPQGGGFTGTYNRFKQQAAPQAAPAAPVISGGIAPPMFQPQAQQSYQPSQQPIDIPDYQTPEQQLGLGGFYEYMNQQMGGMRGYAMGGDVTGGMAEGHLGGYSDGGRLLKGPGDGVSDSIPAVIGKRQPARLADGEFVIPARIVSELGNGSTDAGAKQLYAMMDRVQKARGKTTGKNKVAVNSKANKHLPA